jgi:hypothetical protein
MCAILDIKVVFCPRKSGVGRSSPRCRLTEQIHVKWIWYEFENEIVSEHGTAESCPNVARKLKEYPRFHIFMGRRYCSQLTYFVMLWCCALVNFVLVDRYCEWRSESSLHYTILLLPYNCNWQTLQQSVSLLQNHGCPTYLQCSLHNRNGAKWTLKFLYQFDRQSKCKRWTDANCSGTFLPR